MLDNIIFSINRVMPYFFLIVLGVAFRHYNIVPLSFFQSANRFVFKVALPSQLFLTMSAITMGGGEGSFMLYVLAVTVSAFCVIWLLTELLYKDKALIGTLVQGAFRGNFVILGVPLSVSILGDRAASTAAFATVVIVPVYNVLSVLVLLVRGDSSNRKSEPSILRGVLTNPLIIGAACGVPFMLLNIKIPYMITQTMQYVASTSTPLGLLSIGGMLNFATAAARIKPALYASFIKVVLLPVAVMAVTLFFGYRDAELLTMLILSATPVAVSSYAMASQMGGDEATASNIMIITTFASAFVLAFGIYLLKTFALI